jgi:Mn-containing catalase
MAARAARNLAQQLHLAPIVHLLQTSLGDEENADQLLNQLARPLMSATIRQCNM